MSHACSQNPPCQELAQALVRDAVDGHRLALVDGAEQPAQVLAHLGELGRDVAAQLEFDSGS